ADARNKILSLTSPQSQPSTSSTTRTTTPSTPFSQPGITQNPFNPNTQIVSTPSGPAIIPKDSKIITDSQGKVIGYEDTTKQQTVLLTSPSSQSSKTTTQSQQSSSTKTISTPSLQQPPSNTTTQSQQTPTEIQTLLQHSKELVEIWDKALKLAIEDFYKAYNIQINNKDLDKINLSGMEILIPKNIPLTQALSEIRARADVYYEILKQEKFGEKTILQSQPEILSKDLEKLKSEGYQPIQYLQKGDLYVGALLEKKVKFEELSKEEQNKVLELINQQIKEHEQKLRQMGYSEQEIKKTIDEINKNVMEELKKMEFSIQQEYYRLDVNKLQEIYKQSLQNIREFFSNYNKIIWEKAPLHEKIIAYALTPLSDIIYRVIGKQTARAVEYYESDKKVIDVLKDVGKNIATLNIENIQKQLNALSEDYHKSVQEFLAEIKYKGMEDAIRGRTMAEATMNALKEATTQVLSSPAGSFIVGYGIGYGASAGLSKLTSAISSISQTGAQLSKIAISGISAGLAGYSVYEAEKTIREIEKSNIPIEEKAKLISQIITPMILSTAGAIAGARAYYNEQIKLQQEALKNYQKQLNQIKKEINKALKEGRLYLVEEYKYQKIADTSKLSETSQIRLETSKKLAIAEGYKEVPKKLEQKIEYIEPKKVSERLDIIRKGTEVIKQEIIEHKDVKPQILKELELDIPRDLGDVFARMKAKLSLVLEKPIEIRKEIKGFLTEKGGIFDFKKSKLSLTTEKPEYYYYGSEIEKQLGLKTIPRISEQIIKFPSDRVRYPYEIKTLQILRQIKPYYDVEITISSKPSTPPSTSQPPSTTISQSPSTTLSISQSTTQLKISQTIQIPSELKIVEIPKLPEIKAMTQQFITPITVKQETLPATIKYEVPQQIITSTSIKYEIPKITPKTTTTKETGTPQIQKIEQEQKISIAIPKIQPITRIEKQVKTKEKDEEQKIVYPGLQLLNIKILESLEKLKERTTSQYNIPLPTTTFKTTTTQLTSPQPKLTTKTSTKIAYPPEFLFRYPHLLRLPFRLGGGGGGGGIVKNVGKEIEKLIKKVEKYVPSLTAQIFKIRGKPGEDIVLKPIPYEEKNKKSKK
ncbi:MAG: hypothetical protein QXY70_02285, partial [Nanopusillaceae archaeon]